MNRSAHTSSPVGRVAPRAPSGGRGEPARAERRALPVSVFILGLLFVCCLTSPQTLRGDTVVSTNGERFVGQVLQETTDSVIFESESVGRLTIPRARISEIQRTALPVPTTPPPPAPPLEPPSTNSTAAAESRLLPKTTISDLLWRPPAIGKDKADWIQLKSGEWLRGELRYVQQNQVEFDSDELDQLTLKLKNVRQIYPAAPMWAKFDNREPAFGNIVVSNDLVTIEGPEQVSSPRDELRGITPSGEMGLRDWSGSLSVGVSLQSGNRQLTTVNTSGELARRTPNTRLLLEYLGNYSEVNGDQNANNQRVNSSYDIRLDRHWYVRPMYGEYYHDAIANISLRGTVGVGGGYYLFDRPGLEWNVGAGPAFQYTEYETVEAGDSDTTSTPSAQIFSTFKMDITRRLDISQTFRGAITTQEAGVYTHHSVSTVSFEIKRHLNLDVSFIWDFLQRPKVESNGSTPGNSDYYLTLGFGVRF
jgi:hypothetical protein